MRRPLAHFVAGDERFELLQDFVVRAGEMVARRRTSLAWSASGAGGGGHFVGDFFRADLVQLVERDQHGFGCFRQAELSPAGR